MTFFLHRMNLFHDLAEKSGWDLATLSYRAVELDEEDSADHPAHVADGVVGPQHPPLIVHSKQGPSFRNTDEWIDEACNS